jgi:hydroxymethylpyrimidine pyrophosphatase-like HAD family hydrolase
MRGKVSVTSAADDHLEIGPWNCTKLVGLVEITRRLELDQTSVVGIGNARNDREFLSWVDYAIGIAPLSDDLEDVVDEVIDGPALDGPARWITSALASGFL